MMKLVGSAMQFIAILLASLIALPLSAGASDLIKREVLQRADLTGSNTTEVIVTRIVIAPGATIPRHSHPGDEVIYVVKGGLVSVPGKPPIEFKTGQTVYYPRGKVHAGFTVSGTQTIEAITTHIVDKGKPIRIPAK